VSKRTTHSQRAKRARERAALGRVILVIGHECFGVGESVSVALRRARRCCHPKFAHNVLRMQFLAIDAPTFSFIDGEGLLYIPSIGEPPVVLGLSDAFGRCVSGPLASHSPEHA